MVKTFHSFTPGVPEPQCLPFRCGDLVCITGLEKKKVLNFRLGKVVRATKNAGDRIGVRLLADIDRSADAPIYALHRLNIFTIPRDIGARELAQLAHAPTFGAHQCVSVEDAKLLIKEIDFKYTPPPPPPDRDRPE